MPQNLKNQVEQKPTTKAGQRAEALKRGLPLVLAALLLRRLPDTPGSFKLFSSDWKMWAKIPLGLGMVNEATRFFDWKPPDWGRAMLNAAVMIPLMRLPGNRQEALQMLGSMAFLLPGVAALVKGSAVVGDRVEKPVRDNLGIPPLVTRMGLSLGATLAGMAVFHRFFRGLGMAALNACMRCGGGCAVVCASELGEYAAVAQGMLASKRETAPDTAQNHKRKEQER